MTNLTDLLEEAKSLEVQAKYPDAEEKYSSLIDQAQKTSDPVLASALNGRGIVRRMLRKYADSFTDYLAAFTVAIDDEQRAFTLVNMADIHRVHHNNPESAHESLDEALEFAGSETLMAAKAHDQRGMVYDYMEKKFPEAIGDYVKAKEICQKILGTEPENKDVRNRLAQVQMHLAYCYSETGIPENITKAYAEDIEALNTFKVLGDVAGIVNASTNLGRFNHETQNFDDTLKYYHQALDLATEMNIGRAITPIALELGGAYLSLNRIEEAKPYLEKFVKGMQDDMVTVSDRTTMKLYVERVAERYDRHQLNVPGFDEIRKLF